ncbi:MAG: DPP IV N-terminal domain-containing protein [Phycisphaerales bacterium]|nr:DPP IV N-terminal domain-containing protein [Phycisphaerales bacterium]
MRRRTVASAIALLMLISATGALAQDRQPEAIASLQTVAESSDYTATSTYAQVVEMINAMASASPLANRIDIGTTVENRAIPMLVLADPGVSSPEQAAAQEKMVVLIIGNIHAGEVAGKEALLALAREVLAGDDADLLDHLVLCIVPIYNADGNERFGLDNRPGQIGPEKGMGVRPNAQGLDLNRDFTKTDAPETRALVKVMRQWNPDVFIDTHTTNGSLHRYLITYTGPKSPAGDREIIDYAHDTMMPRITASLKQRTGYDSFFYGNFDRDHTKWESYPAESRYGTTYFGLRNRISILSEAYAYASYKDRVLGSLEFVRECLRDISANRGEIKSVLSAADERAKHNSGRTIVLRSKFKARPEKVTVLGQIEQNTGKERIGVEPCDYLVDLVDDFEATLETTMPVAYLLPPSLRETAIELQWHGVSVLELREDIELNVEVDRITSLKPANREFQNRRTQTVEAERRSGLMGVPAGTLVVRLDQPLGRLAAYLLEAQSDDSFAFWGMLPSLREGEDYPIIRWPEEEQPLLTTPYRPLDDERTFGRIVTEEVLRDRRGMPSFSGNAVNVIRWLDDEHYLINKGGLRKVNATTGRSERWEQAEEIDSAAIARALEGLPTMDSRAARNYANQAARSMDDGRTGALFNHENDLYYVSADGSVAKRLTSTPQREELARFSPNGLFVAFVRDNDLFVVDVATATERALTTGGSDTLRRGKADWVYYEELFGRNWNAYWWSPDSSRIAFLETDSSMVPEFTIVNDAQYQQRVEVARYPKPGQPNPVVQLGIVTAAGGEPQWVDLSSYEAADRLISEVGWWPDSESVYFYVQNRIQTWLDVCRAPAQGGELTRLLRDQTAAWIESPGPLRFLDGGGFLMSSDRAGWRHWYRYDADGNLIAPLTVGEGEMRGIERLDLENNLIFTTGMRDNPIGSDLYRFEVGAGEGKRLTNGQGSHNVSISPSGKYFVDSWSSFGQTPRVELRDAETGRLLRTIDSNPVYVLEEWNLGREEHVVISARDGYPIDATVFYPAKFDARQQYPVWFTTYAGPHAPTVSDRWSGGRVRDQLLANEGIVLFEMHPRSASNRGSVSTWTAYKQLGVSELRDIEDAIRWLTAKPYIDGERVGMSGHSYGGFMTAFAMTHSDLFCAGIAGAAPTDWREYDSIYTERYMSTPQDNPEGYDATSVILAAKDLHGRLRLLHGAIDDNVHMQNTTRLVKALQDADKDFELMIYPGYRHGIFNRHYQRTTNEFILESLGVKKENRNRPAEPLRATERSQADGWYDEGD